MIAEESIRRVKEEVPIVELLSEYISVKQQGGGYFGLCPFHGEKTPSLHIKPSDNFYHCFGCGVSGNAISFIMELEGLSFPEAVKFLGEKYQIEIRESKVSSNSNDREKRTLFAIHQLASEFFKNTLVQNVQLLKGYLKERGLTRQAIERFEIGFAPQSWRGLTEFLTARDFSMAEILQSGLARKNSKGDIYDTFRGRLMFPIMPDSRRIVGFGGRVIPALEKKESEAPKYINSPESIIYHKGESFYGIPQAREAMRRTKKVYLVEGYFDVISLWSSGVENAIATCGTAITDRHARKLSSLVHEASILFDGDDAGRAAAAKSAAVFLPEKIDASVRFLPQGEDPDSLARKSGGDTQVVLENLKRKTVLSCFIEESVRSAGGTSVDELGVAAKSRVANEVSKVLSSVGDNLMREEYRKQAAFQLLLSPDQLRDVGNNQSLPREELAKDSESEEVETDTFPAVSSLSRIDRELLTSVIAERKLLEPLVKNARIFGFISGAAATFIEGLYEVTQLHEESEQREQARNLLVSCGPSWVKLWRESFQKTQEDTFSAEQLFKDCCLEYERESLRQTRSKLLTQIQTGGIPSDRALELSQEVGKLTRRINNLRGEGESRSIVGG